MLVTQTLTLVLLVQGSPVWAWVVSSWKLWTMLRSWSRLKCVAGSPAVTLSTSCPPIVDPSPAPAPVTTVPVVLLESRVSGEPGGRVSTGRVTMPPPGRDILTMLLPGYEGGGGNTSSVNRDSSTWSTREHIRYCHTCGLKHRPPRPGSSLSIASHLQWTHCLRVR